VGAHLTWVRNRIMTYADQEDRMMWEQAMRRSRIPGRFWDADPSAVKGDNRWMHQALDNPAAWAGTGAGFFIHGPFNTGKSAAAAILARDFVNRCHVVLWLSVRDVPGMRFRDTPDMAKLDDTLRRADLLVLDDLGAERFRLESAAGAALEETVRILYERKRPVIFTSNKAWDQFQATYSEGFVSVVKRMAIPITLLDPWGDAPNLVMA
jgi:DNA replication protein DnaC